MFNVLGHAKIRSISCEIENISDCDRTYTVTPQCSNQKITFDPKNITKEIKGPSKQSFTFKPTLSGEFVTKSTITLNVMIKVDNEVIQTLTTQPVPLNLPPSKEMKKVERGDKDLDYQINTIMGYIRAKELYKALMGILKFDFTNITELYELVCRVCSSCNKEAKPEFVALNLFYGRNNLNKPNLFKENIVSEIKSMLRAGAIWCFDNKTEMPKKLIDDIDNDIKLQLLTLLGKKCNIINEFMELSQLAIDACSKVESPPGSTAPPGTAVNPEQEKEIEGFVPGALGS